MKKLLIALLISAAGTATLADAHEGFYHRGGCCYRGNGLGWVAPLAIGGVIGYELSRPNTVIVEQQPVYVPPPVVYQPQSYVQAPPPGYHWQDMVDPQTGVHKIVAVPN